MSFAEQVAKAAKEHGAIRQARSRGECSGHAETSGKVAPCKRYGLWVSAEMCRKCVADPEFKQSLHARWLGQASDRQEPCTHKGQTLEVKEYGCCGGRKKFEAAVFECTQHSRVDETKCWACESYAS